MTEGSRSIGVVASSAGVGDDLMILIEKEERTTRATRSLQVRHPIAQVPTSG